MAPRGFPSGVYVPTVTFFTADDTVDVAATAKHAVRLVRNGVVGLVNLGSFGEGPHLSREEKKAVNAASRKALDDAGFSQVPILSGVADNSVVGTVTLAEDAAAAGADAILLVAPSYYRAAMTEPVLKGYFTAVADRSPLPIVIYNFPGIVAGIDLTSEMLIELAAHPNIIGTKFTCQSSGKLARVAHALEVVAPASTASVASGGYLAFAGMADFLLQALSVGGTGVISGPANIVPRTVVRVYDLFASGKYEEAMAAQRSLSETDYVLTNLGAEGTKAALQAYFGYGGHVRAPLPRIDEKGAAEIAAQIKEIIDLEISLGGN
ncbi:uncharacterized protein V1510DRAFT_418224 [Dipodascopsis tothii]|uniref:uncharacterized protein n=1 Tax=Dipodascopsis tothii TaxID=44089 RepID=UPI0034CEAC81